MADKAMLTLQVSTMLDQFLHNPCIAYFSMEIALDNDIPTYSGGLGVLAGDTMGVTKCPCVS